MLFVDFSLTDDASHQILSTVRRALHPANELWRDPAGAAPGASVGGGSAFGSAIFGSTIFGSALTLSDRPFMEELWPELEAVPMGEGLAGSGADRARRRRKLDIFLDRVQVRSPRMALDGP